ncbi:hypothetical protein PsYK624_011700 [Phanerochaete sordida]|uniref:DUF6533 domain-containing protein n=1 Tax=Phanerochaete sordida TaxID=48140 RepID=A0A9P3L8K0_9APHY|nr:hypothetical protein PsYK624_011700 [Phanerochaete sordida]
MSSDSASQFTQYINSNYTESAIAALVLYDYLITFGQEVYTVWQRRFSIVSFLIATSRWALLIQAITTLIPGKPDKYAWPEVQD